MPDTKTTALEKKSPTARLGIFFASGDDGVRIIDISPNSLAADTDMKTGDKVLTINEKDVNNMSSKETAALIRKSTGTITVVTEPQEDNDVEAAPLINKNKEESSAINDHAIAQSMSAVLETVILLVQVVAAAVICYLLFCSAMGSRKILLPSSNTLFSVI